MLIEIRNTTSGNQGAQLMLRAVLQRMRSEPEPWRFVVARRCATARTRRELDLALLPWFQLLGVRADLPARLLPLRPAGWEHPDRIQVVLDASGFAYGDTWGPGNARMAAAYYGRLKRRGAKIVLLPQALGPFERPEVRAAATEVIRLADLVFARDPTSLAAVRSLSCAHDHVHISNDFTHALRGVPPTQPLPPRTVGLVPNRKMLQRGAASREGYLRLFARLASGIEELGCRPLLILHSREDASLAAAINAGLPHPAPTRRESHPLRLKGLIGQCHALVSSRFHGLVNAMAAAVPAMATSWSHKYRHLMEDFGAEDLLLEPQVDHETLKALLVSMLDDPGHARRAARLREATARQVRATEHMWDRVLSCIRAAPGATSP